MAREAVLDYRRGKRKEVLRVVLFPLRFRDLGLGKSAQYWVYQSDHETLDSKACFLWVWLHQMVLEHFQITVWGVHPACLGYGAIPLRLFLWMVTHRAGSPPLQIWQTW